MLAEVLVGLDLDSSRNKMAIGMKGPSEEPLMTEEKLGAAEHGFKFGQFNKNFIHRVSKGWAVDLG